MQIFNSFYDLAIGNSSGYVDLSVFNGSNSNDPNPTIYPTVQWTVPAVQGAPAQKTPAQGTAAPAATPPVQRVATPTQGSQAHAAQKSQKSLMTVARKAYGVWQQGIPTNINGIVEAIEVRPKDVVPYVAKQLDDCGKILKDFIPKTIKLWSNYQANLKKFETQAAGAVRKSDERQAKNTGRYDLRQAVHPTVVTPPPVDNNPTPLV
jgi:hypothetical protein